MLGIGRKRLAEMVKSWAAVRGKTLDVPEALLEHIAEQAHQLNDKSQGKEGGRIVRKLIADLIEVPLQSAMSRQPAEYRACRTAALDFQPGEAGAAPIITVRFVPEKDPPR